MQETLAEQLGFDAPGFLGADLPDDLDGGAITEALTASIATARDLGRPDPSLQFRLRVLALSGQKLLAARKPKEALYLAQGAIADFRTRPAIAIVTLNAYRALSQGKRLIEFADQILGDPAVNGDAVTKYAAFLRRYNYLHFVTPRPWLFPQFFGDIDKFIEDPFGQIEELVRRSTYEIDGPAKRLMELRNLTEEVAQQDYLFRLRKGRELFLLAKFANAGREGIVELGATEQNGAAGSQGILALWKRLLLIFAHANSKAILGQVIAATPNRSILLAQSHSGVSVPLPLPIPKDLLPLSVVSNETSNPAGSSTFNLKAGAESTARDFAKLVKLAKKEPRIVRIFPDGQKGELYEATLLGKRFTVGRGAATLAYLSGAATYFGSYRWEGHKYLFELQPGPDPLKFSDRETFERAFSDFYTGCLERIVMGPPEVIAFGASTWRIHVK